MTVECRAVINQLSVSVVIPALNEARSIGPALREVPAGIDRVIVVDNGSSDDTAAVARANGATVVHEPRTGYGAACQAGIKLAAGDLVAFMDADYSDYPADLATVIEPVADGRADMVIGTRNSQSRPSALPPHQRFGNWLVCGVISLLYGVRYTDLGPMRCIRREALSRLQMIDADYGWTVEMQLKAARMGLAVMEVPVRSRKRIGKSKISGTIRGSLGAAVKIFYWVLKLSVRKF